MYPKKNWLLFVFLKSCSCFHFMVLFCNTGFPLNKIETFWWLNYSFCYIYKTKTLEFCVLNVMKVSIIKHLDLDIYFIFMLSGVVARLSHFLNVNKWGVVSSNFCPVQMDVHQLSYVLLNFCFLGSVLLKLLFSW